MFYPRNWKTLLSFIAEIFFPHSLETHRKSNLLRILSRLEGLREMCRHVVQLCDDNKCEFNPITLYLVSRMALITTLMHGRLKKDKKSSVVLVLFLFWKKRVDSMGSFQHCWSHTFFYLSFTEFPIAIFSCLCLAVIYSVEMSICCIPGIQSIPPVCNTSSRREGKLHFVRQKDILTHFNLVLKKLGIYAP